VNHSVREQGGVSVVELSGDVDVGGAPELRNLLTGLLEPGSRVVIDLSGVAFIDSSGVGLLVTAHRKAAEVGGELALAAPAGTVERVFELTRTNRLLRIFPTLEEGLAAVGGQ
jgi:anti-sigma B factor antagonist